MTEKTKAVPAARKTELHGRAKPVVKETAKKPTKSKYLVEFAGEISTNLDQTEMVLAAKGIASKVQDMAENLSKMEANDIMPSLDGFRDAFGPQAADQFSQVCTGKIRELISAVQATKSAIDGEISRLESIVAGGDGSDMSMDQPPAAPAPGAAVPPPAPGGEVPAPDAVPPADTEAGAEGVPPPVDADIGDGSNGFAGRARKESAAPKKKGRRLTEENAAETTEFKKNMDMLAALSPKCFAHAQRIMGEIYDLAVGGEVRNKLMNALGHVVGMASSKDSWDDPEAIADMGVSAHLSDGPMKEVINTPEAGRILKQIRAFAHKVAAKHNGELKEDEITPPPAAAAPPPPPPPAAAPSTPLAAGPVMMESRRRAMNIKRLRETKNPDRMILKVFRNVFRECHNATSAVTGTARAFGIDASDVVMIVREAKRRVAEDAVPSLMGVEMGQPDIDNRPALMAQMTKSTAVSPHPGQPNEPLTPADMRAAKIARQKQDAAAGNMPKQPIANQPQKPPVQQVQPGNQTVQPVMMTPQQQQQARANKRRPTV